MIKKILLYISCLFLIGLYASEQTEVIRPTITIYVHGTKTVSRLMLHNFLYCKKGLHHPSKLAQKYHTHKIAKLLCEHGSQFSWDDFYIFGWSGNLSHRARERAAQQFLKALKKLIKKYEQKYKVKPFVRVITHSHGGNMVMHLAQYNNDKEKINIDELILLACPVQHVTRGYLKQSFFKNIYNLYSKRDVIQVADPQGLQPHENDSDTLTKPLFSERRFPSQNNLTQVEVTCEGKGLTHKNFIDTFFIKKLPALLSSVKQGCADSCVDISLL